MNQVFEGPAIEWFALSPLLTLVGGALALLLVGALTPQWPRGGYALLSATTLGAAIVLGGFLWVETDEPRTLIGESLVLDRYALFAMIAMMVATLLSVLTTNDYLEREGQDAPEPCRMAAAPADPPAGIGIRSAPLDSIVPPPPTGPAGRLRAATWVASATGGWGRACSSAQAAITRAR